MDMHVLLQQDGDKFIGIACKPSVSFSYLTNKMCISSTIHSAFDTLIHTAKCNHAMLEILVKIVPPKILFITTQVCHLQMLSFGRFSCLVKD